MRREMSLDQRASLLYATVGTALDCGETPEQIKKLFSKKNIDFVLAMIAQKDAASIGAKEE